MCVLSSFFFDSRIERIVFYCFLAKISTNDHWKKEKLVNRGVKKKVPVHLITYRHTSYAYSTAQEVSNSNFSETCRRRQRCATRFTQASDHEALGLAFITIVTVLFKRTKPITASCTTDAILKESTKL